MNKKVKIILILLVVVILAYIVFVTVDVIRLRYSKIGTKPIVTISEKMEDNKVVYSSIGYNIKYYVNINTDLVDNMDYIGIYGYGAEFRFLGMLIWAWVE